MTIPEAAIEAAAEGIGHDSDCGESRTPSGLCNCGSVGTARAAIEAAMPAIREAIAQDAVALRKGMLGNSQFADGYRTACNDFAARIVRGGTQ